jgi:hypothetical protein
MNGALCRKGIQVIPKVRKTYKQILGFSKIKDNINQNARWDNAKNYIIEGKIQIHLQLRMIYVSSYLLCCACLYMST